MQVERMLAEARKGRSSALVLVGESGIGKTALLAHAREKARGFRALAATGVPAEEGVSFAGLDQLLGPVRERFEDIPAPQAAALRAALDLTSSARLDRDAVLRGTRSTLAALADESPVLCTVDDAHFLDPGSLAALSFAARRLGPEGIVMLFACREVAEVAALDGIPTLELRGLDVAAARELLEAVRPGLVAPGRRRAAREVRPAGIPWRSCRRRPCSTRPSSPAACRSRTRCRSGRRSRRPLRAGRTRSRRTRRPRSSRPPPPTRRRCERSPRTASRASPIRPSRSASSASSWRSGTASWSFRTPWRARRSTRRRLRGSSGRPTGASPPPRRASAARSTWRRPRPGPTRRLRTSSSGPGCGRCTGRATRPLPGGSPRRRT